MATSLELLVTASRLARARVLKVVDDLETDQLASRPSPTAHSLGWTLWHLARCADKYRSELPAWPGNDDRTQIWERERLAERWGIAADLLGGLEVGTVDVDDATAARLLLPPRAALLDYARRAFAGLDAAVGLIDDDRLATEFTSLAADGRTTVGQWFVGAIAHDNRHLGEMEYAKGLLGLRGTVTR